MVEQTPREYLTKILDLSREMVGLASVDPGYELDVGCRTVFGALCDYGYSLKKMAETELAAHESALVAGISPPESPGTVLIVNDDPDFLKYLALLFWDNGFEPLTAISRNEAMELTRASKPDLVILDISIPGGSGLRVYQELKEDAKLGAIPVVLMTAPGNSLGHCIEGGGQLSGAVGVVVKPLDVERLWQAVRAVLGVSSD